MPAIIRQLSIKRFRCLRDFTWRPEAGINVVVGPADGGKTTILAAIALLLAPTVVGARTEFDYIDRDVRSGFEIEALIGSLDAATLATDRRQPPLFGLKPDGSIELLPAADTEPVLKVRVTGTADLEAIHEIIAPAGDPTSFSVALRRKLGLVRVLDGDTAARALRMSQGGLLGRQFDLAGLRGAVQTSLAAAAGTISLPKEATDIMDELRALFKSDGLPDDVMLGLVSPQGGDLLALLDVIRGSDSKTAIPIALSGNGTKALLAVSLLSRVAPNSMLLVFDEPERGLEPFRQRVAASKIADLGTRGQAFISTHSPTMLQALSHAAIWRLDINGNPSSLTAPKATALLKRDAEAVFSPLPIVGEGKTEVGFLRAILPALTGRALEELGIHLVDGGGQRPSLELAEGLADAGMRVGLFADNEDDLSGTRDRVEGKTVAFFWKGVKNLEEAVATFLPLADMPSILAEARMEERYLMDQLLGKLPTLAEKVPPVWDAIVASYDEPTLRAGLNAAMSEYSWYKNYEHGERLGLALLKAGLPTEMRAQLEPFVARLG